MRSLALLLLLAAPSVFAADNEITVQNVIALMNAYRAEQNLPPLREDPRLSQAARDIWQSDEG